MLSRQPMPGALLPPLPQWRNALAGPPGVDHPCLSAAALRTRSWLLPLPCSGRLSQACMAWTSTLPLSGSTPPSRKLSPTTLRAVHTSGNSSRGVLGISVTVRLARGGCGHPCRCLRKPIRHCTPSTSCLSPTPAPSREPGEGDLHYLPYLEAIKHPYTNSHQPSLQQGWSEKKAKCGLPITSGPKDSATSMAWGLTVRAQYVRAVVECKDCIRPRCMYSVKSTKHMGGMEVAGHPPVTRGMAEDWLREAVENPIYIYAACNPSNLIIPCTVLLSVVSL